MSQHERFRALLSKALCALESYPQDSEDVCTLCSHIEAALAEPDAPCSECQNNMNIARLERKRGDRQSDLLYEEEQRRFSSEHQRDEARAEVDRLRSDVASLEAGITAQDEVLTARYNQQLARAETAYQRGAEAMRESAGVTAFITLFSNPNQNRVLLDAVVSAIRALPIPEEKS